MIPVATYLNGQNERFFVIEDYSYKGFLIQIDKKESTNEFYGRLYNDYEPNELIQTEIINDIEIVKSNLENYVNKLI